MVDSRLTSARKRCKYDFKKHVRKTPVFRKSELVFVDRPSLLPGRHSLNTTDKATYKKLLSRAEQHIASIAYISIRNPLTGPAFQIQFRSIRQRADLLATQTPLLANNRTPPKASRKSSIAIIKGPRAKMRRANGATPKTE